MRPHCHGYSSEGCNPDQGCGGRVEKGQHKRSVHAFVEIDAIQSVMLDALLLPMVSNLAMV